MVFWFIMPIICCINIPEIVMQINYISWMFYIKGALGHLKEVVALCRIWKILSQSCCVHLFWHVHLILSHFHSFPYIRWRKNNNPVLWANGFQKAVGRSSIFFFLFFFTFFKITLKNCVFFLARFARNFSFNFLSKKWLILQFNWGVKKKLTKWEKKRSVGPVKQGFLFFLA